MKRLLALWLTLLGAFWLTREAASALIFQRADQGSGALAELLIVPALQAAIVGWLSRRPPHSPTPLSPRERGEKK